MKDKLISITCNNCGKEYHIHKPKGKKAYKCKKCGSLIEVNTSIWKKNTSFINKLNHFPEQCNLMQRILVALTLPCVIYLVSYGIINKITDHMIGPFVLKAIHKGSSAVIDHFVRQQVPPDVFDFKYTWWLWAIVILFFIIIEFWWLGGFSRENKK